jgi:hypothetical protein
MVGSSVMMWESGGRHLPDNYSRPSLIRCVSGAGECDREWEDCANGWFVSDDAGEKRLPSARQRFASSSDMTANGRIARMVGSSVMMRGRGDCHVPDQLFASSAYSLSPATTSPFAVASTSSIISAVSRPVRVFCWLG